MENHLEFMPELSDVNHLEQLTSLWFTLRDASPETIEARLRVAMGPKDLPEAEVIQAILRYRKGEITEVEAIKTIYDLLKEFLDVES